jgi:phenylacetate-coenzyme A ligase PaaK-like adenylate-forming protein
MAFYQKFVRNYLYPLDCYRTKSVSILRYMQEFERSQYIPAEDLKKIAFNRVREILDHANQNIPYYKERFKAAGILPGDVSHEEDMLAIPILEKRQLQTHRDDLLDPKWPKGDLILDSTGGSTGTPVEYYRSRDRDYSRTAATWRHNRFVGWDIGDKSASLWGAVRDAPPPTLKKKLRNLLIDRNFLFNTAGFRPDDIIAFNNQLKRFRPKVMLAYANSLALFARYLKEHGITPYQPAAIVTSAEMLSENNRQLIEEVYGAPVYNRYGAREFSVIASECQQRNGLHVMAEGLFVEIVKDGRRAAPGEVGELIVTDLLNEPMPLIRYRIGDAACWKSGQCDCGRGLPRLERIAGRVTDFLIGADGRLCSGAVLTVAMVAKRPSLGQLQIEQSERGKIVYRIATRSGKPISALNRRFLLDQTAEYLGEETQVSFDFVEAIPHEASGKFLFSKSTVRDLF